MHFRPNLWRYLERDREHLNLDLFWPVKIDQDIEDDEGNESDIFPIQELRPLCDFRRLRSLQLNGMMESYQKYIWQTCWLNPGLEDLTLEMALEPSIKRPYKNQWPAIEGAWQIGQAEGGSVEYLYLTPIIAVIT